MKNLKKIILGSVAVVLFGGCATMQPASQGTVEKSAFVVMKTPVLKYADQGFIHKKAGATILEIYANGVAVMKLEISEGEVCNGTGLFSCMSKREFNKRYLSAHYPDDTFEKILRGEVIFGGKNLQQHKGGFSQKITQNGSYAIDYSVLNHSIVFRDTLTPVLIKVKENR